MGFQKESGRFWVSNDLAQGHFLGKKVSGSTISPVSVDSIPAICPETAPRLRTEDREILVCGEY